MDRFLRHFIIFVITLLVSAGTLTYVFISGDLKIKDINKSVDHTYDIIMQVETMATNVEAALAAQRGYLLTGNETFFSEYKYRKSEVSDQMAILAELTKDNNSQQSRLNEMREYVNRFLEKLDERARIFGASYNKKFLEDIGTIDMLRNNILRLNQAILTEEYAVLNQQISAVKAKRDTYQVTLIAALSLGTFSLIFLNALLLMLERKRNVAETSLKDSKNRFVMAVEGTQDGIFDWNLKTGEIFYSRRVFEMLGYDRASFTGSVDDFKVLIHPEDIDRVNQYVDQYISGHLSEYMQEYRAKHASGRWVWIQSRAKGEYSEEGKVLRMVGAHTDISHLKQVQVRLESEKKQAEDANKAKSEFLAHMSHEIRTPLTAISGIAEIMQKNDKNLDDKQKQLVSTLMSSSSALKDLVNDILDFSKIESREVELDREFFRVDHLIEEVCDMMKLRAADKGIAFASDYSAVIEKDFYGDRIRFRQILVNLIGNAIKFTDEGRVNLKTYVEMRNQQPCIRIDISDTGIGIASDNLDIIFERFKQGDASVSRKYGGTGLGLPISRNLVQLMGGDIFVSSAPGTGSTFTVILPLETLDDDVPENVRPSMQSKLSDHIQKLAKGEHKVLIVEDYKGNIVLIGYILDELSIDYDVAENGAQAVDLWQSRHYDLILMDIQMPEMDGFTATKMIRGMEKERSVERTPIIGMTAHALVGDREKCLAVGMDGYLPKPIIAEDLKKEIYSFLAEAS